MKSSMYFENSEPVNTKEEEDTSDDVILDMVSKGIVSKCDSAVGLCWDVKERINARNGVLPHDFKPLTPRKKFHLIYIGYYYRPIRKFASPFRITKYYLPDDGGLIYSRKCDEGHSACNRVEMNTVVDLFNEYSSQQYRKKKFANPKSKRKVVKNCKCK